MSAVLDPSADTRSRAERATSAYFRCHGLHAYYGQSYVVQGVGFEVHEGEIVALLGRNGAGKTSTLRAIARLDDPHLAAGEIWLDGDVLEKIEAGRRYAVRVEIPA